MNRHRDYEATDLEACLQLFDTNVPGFFVPSEQDEFRAFLEDLPGPYLVLLDDDEDVLVACGGYAIREGGQIADLCWGMVRGDLHGQGLGWALTDARIDRIRLDPRVEEIRLSTSQHTVGFYERFGFRTTGVKKDAYATGIDRHEMRLVLADVQMSEESG